MSLISAEVEVIQRANNSVRYLEHGWPSELCRWHLHKQYELHFITKGPGIAYIGDYIGDFQSNSLFFIGSYLPHNWISNSNAPVAIRDMLIQFDGDNFDAQLFPEFLELKPLFQSASYGIEFINIQQQKCIQRFTAIKHTKGLQRLNLTIDFLTYLCQHSEQKKLSLHNFNLANNHTYDDMDKSIDYILKNYMQDLSITTLAQFTNLSNSTYCRKFYKSMGIKFSEFLNKIRIAKACSLLYQTNQPISTICYNVGFQNLSNFNRQFLKFKNITPSAYRKELHRLNHQINGNYDYSKF